MIAPIVFVLVAIALAFLAWWLSRGLRILKKAKKESIIVYGSKGKGKSLLFQYLANKTPKYISTTDFGGDCKKIDTKDISVAPNTYENTIKGEFVTIPKKRDWEGRPVFLDDCAVYLPNYADSALKKAYPSLPIAYAVWRHLYNAPIYLNCQTLERTWKPLREQADTFVLARGVIKLPFVFILRFTYYDNFESASKKLLPLGSRIFNNFSKAEADQFRATNGEIKKAFVFLPKRKIYFDSRYFHRKFFGRKSPSSK